MKKFNVIIEDTNIKKFVSYDILPYLRDKYNNAPNKPDTLEEFKDFVQKWASYQWWSRCQYEIILQSWVGSTNPQKIDVYYQIMMNLDVIAEILKEDVKENVLGNS